MTQILLNIQDESKAKMLIDFLKSLNYISVQKLSDDNIVVSEEEKDVMRERLKKAKPEHFEDWEKVKKSLNLE